MLSKVRLPSWVTSPTFILGLLWLLTAIADRLWFSLDNAPPAWDQGEHLNKALNFWRVLQSPERFSTNWWTDFWQQAPTYRAPLTYLFTVPILQWIGQTYDAATSVNLIFTAILLASVYHLGKHLFSATVGLWAAVFCAIAPFLVFQRTDYLLDYPLAAIATFSYLCMSKWRDARGWRQWTWAIASGIGVGACFLTRGTGIIFIFLPCLWIVAGTLWRRQWLRLIQLVVLFVAAWFVIGGWFTTNWLTIISSTLQTNALGNTFYKAPQANTLAGWLFYAQMLPDMFSPFLLFSSLGCWLLFGGRWIWRNLAITPQLVKVKTEAPESSLEDIPQDAKISNTSKTSKTSNTGYSPTQSKARNWRWLALFTLGTYILVSLGTHKLNRFILPYLPSVAIVLAYGFSLGKGLWWNRFRYLAVSLAALSVFVHQFPVSAGMGIIGERRFPDVSPTYPHVELINTITQKQPYLRSNLGVLTNTAQLNPMTFDFFGASTGFQVYGRQVGMNPKYAEQDSRSLTWYITKTGDQGDYTNLEAGQVALKQKLENNANLPIIQQWKLPDGSDLRLHQREPLPLTVTPVQGAAKSDRLQLLSVNVPAQAPSGQPVPVTYTWQGNWENLKNAIVVLTWQQQNGKAYWIHDHAIAFGNLYQAPTSNGNTNSGEFRVTEVTAMLPPATLPNDTYVLKATVLDRKKNGGTGVSLPLTIPSVQIQLAPVLPQPAPELDLQTQLSQLTTLLPAGKIDPIFVELATINQYDPTQDYVLQAEKSLSYRMQQADSNDPNRIPLLYNLAFTYILQKQPQPAIATFEKLTTLDAQNPYAWTYLGFVHLYNWQGAQAQAAFDKAAQIAPQLPELRTLNIVAAALQFNIPKALQLLNAK